MIIKKLPVGPLMTNCYIIGCENTKEAVVIDPGGDEDQILTQLAQLSLILKYIINTHGHFDHVSGNKRLKDVTGAEIIIHPEDAPMLEHISSSAINFDLSVEDSPPPDIFANDGDNITFGTISLKVIHTPGHSRGSISLFTEGHVFTGDTLFQGAIGRTDFPGGDYNTIISSIKNKLLILDEETKVYSGHTQVTTIGNEKRTNPFLQ